MTVHLSTGLITRLFQTIAYNLRRLRTMEMTTIKILGRWQASPPERVVTGESGPQTTHERLKVFLGRAGSLVKIIRLKAQEDLHIQPSSSTGQLVGPRRTMLSRDLGGEGGVNVGTVSTGANRNR